MAAMKPARDMTEAELVESLRADMRRPFREVRRTHLLRLREQAEAMQNADLEATERRLERERRRKRNGFIEKHPGQLRSIHIRLKAGDSSGLSAEARRMLVLIARRPDVTSSRKWTTAKTSRVTINEDQLRWHFHHWAASMALNAGKRAERRAAELAAAERVRQDEVLYESLAVALERDEEEQELKDVPDGPWIALNDAEAPTLRVIDGGRAG
jgi:hypothetical protein